MPVGIFQKDDSGSIFETHVPILVSVIKKMYMATLIVVQQTNAQLVYYNSNNGNDQPMNALVGFLLEVTNAVQKRRF